ncbi:4-hydroxy-4-methyl-2-oxoglutarate aldolase [Arthrobacter sp. R1-13]
MSEGTMAEEWLAFGTPAISDSNGRQGVLSSRIRPQTVSGLVGRAFCVRVVVGDSGSLHQALEVVPSGSVLVVDAGGFADRAVWGEVLTVAAQHRGVVGAVIDGAVRDVAAIRRRGFPVYSAAISAAGPHKACGGTWGAGVSCGGVSVNTGDLVVADEDGVVVVPWELRETVAASTRATLKREQSLMAQILDGLSTAEFFGLRPGHVTKEDAAVTKGSTASAAQSGETR